MGWILMIFSLAFIVSGYCCLVMSGRDSEIEERMRNEKEYENG